MYFHNYTFKANYQVCSLPSYKTYLIFINKAMINITANFKCNKTTVLKTFRANIVKAHRNKNDIFTSAHFW